jgi:hypothetical protein
MALGFFEASAARSSMPIRRIGFGVKDEPPRNFLILASVEFGIISSLAMRPAWLQMRATMK